MNRSHAVTVAILVVVCVGSAGAVPTERVLVAADAETGETYLTAPVENGTTVALTYTHSVEQTPVVDEYAVRGDRLVMTRMVFESYGWGLPSGADVARENGSFVFDPDRSYTRLTVAPGEVAGHTLRVGDRRYDLVALTDGRSVTLRLERRPPLATVLETIL
ncbi:DUF1850 domain-containing protein [Haloarcula litorea]|uniref:DUF1850 domain-containing protein n=1 Tax=Haloarcula litorea TaxID=3032579 RepID=UPI0023E84209|nr:DUF1850 domain-containing protein [Halomicroarcula sp. GDY20]